MTDEEKKLHGIAGGGNPFTVPEGYFENLTERVMQNIGEQASPATTPTLKVVKGGLWRRWIAAAAVVVLVVSIGFISVKIGGNVQNSTTEQVLAKVDTPKVTDTPSVEAVSHEDAAAIAESVSDAEIISETPEHKASTDKTVSSHRKVSAQQSVTPSTTTEQSVTEYSDDAVDYALIGNSEIESYMAEDQY